MALGCYCQGTQNNLGIQKINSLFVIPTKNQYLTSITFLIWYSKTLWILLLICVLIPCIHLHLTYQSNTTKKEREKTLIFIGVSPRLLMIFGKQPDEDHFDRSVHVETWLSHDFLHPFFCHDHDECSRTWIFILPSPPPHWDLEFYPWCFGDGSIDSFGAWVQMRWRNREFIVGGAVSVWWVRVLHQVLLKLLRFSACTM